MMVSFFFKSFNFLRLFSFPLFLSISVILLNPALLSASEKESTPSPVLEKNTLPARGRQETLLTIPAPGKYAITAKSASGTAIQLVDHLSGPGILQGIPGKENGRLDRILDKGTYKIIVQSHAKGTGNAKIDVKAFREKNRPVPPEIIELKTIRGTLSDLEQISYWLHITGTKNIIIEAAGRNLTDLQIFKDGSWRIHTEPMISKTEPAPGKPMNVRGISIRLDPGLYLVTAYGGPPLAWSTMEDEHPFFIRYGIPRLGIAGRKRYTVSPFGFDRWIVSGQAGFFRLELPEALPAKMTVAYFRESNPFNPHGETAVINKKILPPATELHLSPTTNDRIVTVTATSGQPYVLQHFEKKDRYTFRKSGHYFLSTIHSGSPGDAPDATALITQIKRNSRTPEFFNAQVIPIGKKMGFHRKFNLLDPMTLFIEIRSPGPYSIKTGNVDAKIRVEPFFIEPPRKYKTPPFQALQWKGKLDAGFHVITIEPIQKGIIDVFVGPEGMKSPAEETPARACAIFPNLELKWNSRYTCFLNRIPGVSSGIILRELPLNLRQPLPLTQKPGEIISFPIRVSEKSILTALSEDGKPIETQVDGKPLDSSRLVSRGDHIVTVRNPFPHSIACSIETIPETLLPEHPLPAISSTLLENLPEFPVLQENAPVFFDLRQNSKKTFRMLVKTPGLYTIKSTGLLATEGRLRTRTNPALIKRSQNGSGRNFLIRKHLPRGEYQLSVSTLGKSAGHLGLELSRTGLLDGGRIGEGTPVNLFLSTNQAVRCEFQIDEKMLHSLQAMGLERFFQCTVKGKDGWPVFKPGIKGNLREVFEPGKYSLIVYPDEFPGKTSILLSKMPPPLKYDGHGPHQLPLATRILHTWMEPQKGKERVPDQWNFQLPAEAEMILSFPRSMTGKLERLKETNSEKIVIEKVTDGWKGRLPKGTWMLSLKTIRKNNRFPYHVEVDPTQLLDGMKKTVSAPVRIPVSIGEEGIYSFSSIGIQDVRAKLVDGRKQIVAETDDAPDTWNFDLETRLSSGYYDLVIDPVGKTKASSEIRLKKIKETFQPAVHIPSELKSNPINHVDVFPLNIPEDIELLSISADAKEPASLFLEGGPEANPIRIASASGRSITFKVPVSPNRENRNYLLRVRSPGNRDNPITIHVTAPEIRTLTEKDMENGVSISKSGEILSIKTDRPGLFRFTPFQGTIYWTDVPDSPLKPVKTDILPVRTGTCWIGIDFAKNAGKKETLKWDRVIQTAWSEIPVSIPDGRKHPIRCDIRRNNNGPVLVTVQSQGGAFPVFVTGIEDAQFRPALTSMAPTISRTVSLFPEEDSIWIMPKGVTANRPEIRLRMKEFFPAVPEEITWGIYSKAIPANNAESFLLPAGNKRVTIALEKGMGVVLSQNGKPESFHFTENGSESFILFGGFDALTILNPNSEKNLFSLSVLPLEPEDHPENPIGPARIFARRFSTSGKVRLFLDDFSKDPVNPWTLQVRGSAESATLFDTDGNITDGFDQKVTPGSILDVRVRPGLLTCRLTGIPSDNPFPQESVSEHTEIILEPPAIVPLSGNTKIFRFQPEKPVILRFRTSGPVFSALKQGSLPWVSDFHETKCSIDAALPPGQSSSLMIRSAGNATLSGQAEVTYLSPITLVEGEGSEVLLFPGETRVFSFLVNEQGYIGIGIRSNPDKPEVRLYDSTGKHIGTGVVQYQFLSRGSYMITVHAPETSRPVHMRPILAGLEKPGSGPPGEIIRSYMEND